jgi:hypothetical protein
LDISPEECKSAQNRDTCIPMFIPALLTLPSYVINVHSQQQMNGFKKIYTMGYYSALKKNEVMSFEGK